MSRVRVPGELDVCRGDVAWVRQSGGRLAILLVLHRPDHLPAGRLGMRHRAGPLVRRPVTLTQNLTLVPILTATLALTLNEASTLMLDCLCPTFSCTKHMYNLSAYLAIAGLTAFGVQVRLLPAGGDLVSVSFLVMKLYAEGKRSQSSGQGMARHA